MPAAIDFFDNVETINMPASSAGKKQPWTAFHQVDASLINSKDLVVDVPTTEETGSTVGRVTGTGSLRGNGCGTCK